MDNNKIIFSGRSKHPNMNINSRSGSMLVLVLVILAVSIILITSALMISTAGRQRYYKDAEREQASLTAMSAARLICQAVVKNDISVDTLENLATNGDPTELFSIIPSGTGAEVKLSSSGIPGLAGIAGSESSAVFGYEVVGYGTIDEKDYITATVTTTLDAGITGTASTEKVVLYLERKEINLKGFINSMTVGDASTDTTNNFKKLTVGATSDTDPCVIHGNVIAGASGPQTFNTDFIFTGHVKFASGTDFYGDIIFYGDGASIETGGVGHGLNSLSGDVFFLRDTKDTVFTNEALYVDIDHDGRTLINTTNIDIDAGGVYLLNSIFKPDIQHIVDGIVVGDNNSEGSPGYVPTAATITALTAAAEAMTASVEASAALKVLTTDQARPLFQYQTHAMTTDSDVMTYAIPITLDNLAIEGYTITVPGAYYINLVETEEIVNNLIFDLTNGPISLYLIDTSGMARKLEIDNAWIKFIYGDEAVDRVGKILLLDGADITIGPPNNDPDMGIWGSADHASTPFLFIFGLGEAGPTNPNIITIKNGTLEGFVGLYGTDGRIIIQSDPVLYGRFEAAYIEPPEDVVGGQNSVIQFSGRSTGSTPITTTIIKYVEGGYIVN